MNYLKKNIFEENNIKILIIVRLFSKRLKSKATLIIQNLSLIEILILRFVDQKHLMVLEQYQNQNSCKVILILKD